MHHVSHWNRSRRDPIQCTFKVIPPPANTGNPNSVLVRKDDDAGGKKKKKPQQQQPQHAVALYVDGRQISRGCGRTINAAKNAACKLALESVGMRTFDD